MAMVHNDARDYKVAVSAAAKHMREKLENIRMGLSHVYQVGWTFERFAQTWAGNSAVWCADVTKILGVPQSMKLIDFWRS